MRQFGHVVAFVEFRWVAVLQHLLGQFYSGLGAVFHHRHAAEAIFLVFCDEPTSEKFVFIRHPHPVFRAKVVRHWRRWRWVREVVGLTCNKKGKQTVGVRSRDGGGGWKAVKESKTK